MSIGSLLGGVKDKITDKLDDNAEKVRNLAMNEVARKHAPAWMKETELITGKPCTSWEQIAWDDPEISLQYWLCDPVHIQHLKHKKTRAKALACLTPEQLEVYYERRDGYSYSDIEKKGWKESITAEVMRLKRKKAEVPEEVTAEDVGEMPEEVSEDPEETEDEENEIN